MPLMRRGPGIVGMAARTAVVAGTATAVSGRVARRQQEKDIQQHPERYAQPEQAAPAPAPAAPGTDAVAEIQRFAELRDKGILTDEEFAAKKAQLLGL